MTERKKPTYDLHHVNIVPAETLWPNAEHCVGKFVAMGYMKAEQHPAYSCRTSLLVKIDIEAGSIETQNSIYMIR